MVAKAVVFLCLVCAALGLPQSYGPPPPPSNGYSAPGAGQDEAPAQYNFDWSVKDDESGNDFGHEETRDGDFTEGSYYVLLPDGLMQRVDYTVDGDSGFVAEISYEEIGQGGLGGGYEAPRAQPSRSGYN